MPPSPFDMTRWMDAETIRAFEASCRHRRYRAGETVYLQGAPGNEMYRLVSGSARLSVADPAGREIVIAFFEAGACFGDSSMIDGGPRSQTAEARTDMELAVLDQTEFDRLRAAHRDFDTGLLRLLALQMRSLGDDLARMNRAA